MGNFYRNGTFLDKINCSPKQYDSETDIDFLTASFMLLSFRATPGLDEVIQAFKTG